MTVWKTIPVTEQPELILHCWAVFEDVKTKARHFNGYSYENREGRVSSMILSFDPTTMRGVTRSGRVYELSGEPGQNGDAIYVMNRWLAINSITREDIMYVDPKKNPMPEVEPAK